ncbi:MAG: FGGY family carbohydrate kinase, partial [bacterium]
MASALPLAHDARGAFRTMQSQAESIILALDCGTTSVRAIVFEGDRARSSAQREFTQHFPAPGLVEHEADEIWTALSACMKDAIASAGLCAQDVAAIGITNQRETIVVWDRATGRPIHRAIVWQDRRTAPALEALRAAGHEQAVRTATGLTLDPYFSASKLAWILDHVDGARTRAERGELAAGTIDAWVLWNLTKGAVHATDASNASRTMLARIEGAEGAAWDDALCALFRVPRAVLPAIVDSAGSLGVADAKHLGAAIPVTGIAGDQQAALFGQGAVAEGDAKCTFGTGCFLLANAGRARPDAPKGLLATVAWRIDGVTTYAVEGGVFVGGSAVQWLRDGLRLFERAPEV